MTADEEPCGEQFDIDAVDIIVWGSDKPVAMYEGTTLICSLSWGHQPNDFHSDGVNDWRSE
jgi:hypothetical protein